MKPMIPCFGCGCQDLEPNLQMAQRWGPVLIRLSCAKCGRHTRWFGANEQQDMENAWNEEEVASQRYDMIDVDHRLTDITCACDALRKSIDTVMEREDEQLSPGMQALLREARRIAEDTLKAISSIEHQTSDWLYPQDEEDEYPEVDDDDY